MTKRATAFLEYEVSCDCPHCNESVDILDIESNAGDNSISARIFTNQWDQLKGWPIECPHCKNDFELEKLEY